jgi:hypothetical protein
VAHNAIRCHFNATLARGMVSSRFLTHLLDFSYGGAIGLDHYSSVTGVAFRMKGRVQEVRRMERGVQ